MQSAVVVGPNLVWDVTEDFLENIKFSLKTEELSRR